jgi:hypothetical protein
MLERHSFLDTPLLSEYLYGVKPHDDLTLALVSFLLIGVTLFASYLPAQRAAGTLWKPCGTNRSAQGKPTAANRNGPDIRRCLAPGCPKTSKVDPF